MGSVRWEWTDIGAGVGRALGIGAGVGAETGAAAGTGVGAGGRLGVGARGVWVFCGNWWRLPARSFRTLLITPENSRSAGGPPPRKFALCEAGIFRPDTHFLCFRRPLGLLEGNPFLDKVGVLKAPAPFPIVLGKEATGTEASKFHPQKDVLH